MSNHTDASATSKKLRLAIRVAGGKQWIAGFHYLTNLLTALRHTGEGNDIQPVFFPAWATEASDIQRLAEFSSEVYDFEEWKTDKVVPFLRSKNLDCLFATADYGPELGIPLLSWLFDFQHKELPEMFPEYDLNVREEMFQAVLERANIVILSSNHAAQVCQKFYPAYMHKIRVMPFVAHIPDEVFDRDPSSAVRRYHLPRKFIYIPNQFWKHKNHDLVIEALHIAKAEEPGIMIVCSGTLADTRDQFYVPYLRSKIQVYELMDNIRLLGLIPEEDVFALMRAAICVLQPSMYEGWSTVVEQAKSMGVPMLCSDLQVHREQNPPDSRFFPVHDAHELADLLVATYRNGHPGPNKEAESAARANCLARSQQFGHQFKNIIRETIAEFHRQGSEARESAAPKRETTSTSAAR